MSRKVGLSLFGIAFLLALLAAVIGLTVYYQNLPENLSQHETILVGQNRFNPGSQAALRVLVRDTRDAAPLENAEVRVSIKAVSSGESISLFEGKTDAGGTANIAFRVPEKLAGEQTLVVDTLSPLGSDRIERPVQVERDTRVLLSTDKPIYQPGQIIHIRALALNSFDLHPAAGQEIEIVIADGKGNKIYREKLGTSDYGVASTDFQLATQVNTGAYQISAVMGSTTSEKTVTVENYVLPKFKINLHPERPYYLPGETVHGQLQVDYFFGKPVAGGQVVIEGYTFDVERNVQVHLEGQTSAEGGFDFEFALPAYLAGSDLEGGAGRFYLQAVVTDLAQHSELSNLSLPISQSQIIIDAVPESGHFRPGVENILYILTSYPDGSPAETDLQIQFYEDGRSENARSGPYGLAEVRYTPANPWQQLSITASDASGASAGREFTFEGEWADESVILRPDRAVYRVGDTMGLNVFTSQPGGTVYLDIVREGQTVSTRAVPVKDGHAEIAVDLTPDLYGTLELHAYKILASGNITRDTRLVVVDAAADLSLSLTPGSDVYRPGEAAGVDLQVAGADGQAVQAAVGVAVVDESVFALAEQDPGFAKLYFMLEKELLEPKFDLHGFGLPQILTGESPTDAVLRDARTSAAQASLAESALHAAPFALQANSHTDALNRAYELRQNFFQTWSKILFAVLLGMPLVVAGFSVSGLARRHNLARSLVVVLCLAYALTLAFLLWPLGPDAQWVQSPLDRLSFILNRATWSGEALAGVSGLAGITGLLILVISWIRNKDHTLGGSLAGVVFSIVVLAALVVSSGQANLNPSQGVLALGLAGYGLLCLAFLLRVAGLFFEKRWLAGLAGIGLFTFLLFGVLPVLGSANRSTGNIVQRKGLVEDMAFGGAPMLMEAPAEAMPMAPAREMAVEDGAKTSGTTRAAEPPRLRQYFPETLYWLPEAITAEDGTLRLEIPMADSITTWRMTALASSQDGRLGSASLGIKVFQDFFIDLDLPLSLTVGDEVSIPVGVFNYLAEEQTVRLEVQKEGWFELLDEPVKEMTIAANDISVVYFRLKAQGFGQQPFQVTAIGSHMSDAMRKEVRVYPDGKPVRATVSDRLTAGQPVDQTIDIPKDAIPGTQSVLVKIYPGVLSQVVEGLDSILRMPYGCFEQTSSTTYPNLLVMDYLKTTQQVSPETQMKAEEYINLGYQRLTTFEVDGGGFSLFGDAPADRMLTAYGLQEFTDMRRVQDVDPALIERAAAWLLSSQREDGSWDNDQGLVHETTWSNLKDDRLPVTAYIIWSLVEAGYSTDPRTQKGLEYIREFQGSAEDTYVLALVANALVAADRQVEDGALAPVTRAVLERLAAKAVREGNGFIWESDIATFMGSEGQVGSIETTALAAYAFLRADVYPDLANGALLALIQQKDSYGTWYSTQATVLTLKALIQSIRAGGENADATVTVSLNGGQTRTLRITPDSFDVVQLLQFEDIVPGAENQVSLQVEGSGNLMYQVTSEYYLPWDKVSLYPQALGEDPLVDIDLHYDRTELEVNDTLSVNVKISLAEGQAESALIDLGIPPGFTVEVEDLQALVIRYDDIPQDYADATLERYELTGRQLLVYLRNLQAGKPLEFSYRLRAKYPLKVQAPASRAYDYYNPQVAGETQPLLLVVTE